MKPWYQYRFEEAGYVMDNTYAWILKPNNIAGRLKHFLLFKLHFGGIEWRCEINWTDWKWTYGSVEE